MFGGEYQKGSHVEILGTTGQNPLAAWRVSGPAKGVQKVFDPRLKGSVYISSAGCKMQLPRDERAGLGLSQPYLVLQIQLTQAQPFAMELVLTDSNSARRRMILSTSFADVKVTPLHCQLPLASLLKDVWLNLVLPLADLTSAAFRGCSFRLLDMLQLSGTARIRRIFTLRDPLGHTGCDPFMDTQLPQPISGSGMRGNTPTAAPVTDLHLGVMPLPRGLEFPLGLDNYTQVLDPRGLTGWAPGTPMTPSTHSTAGAAGASSAAVVPASPGFGSRRASLTVNTARQPPAPVVTLNVHPSDDDSSADDATPTSASAGSSPWAHPVGSNGLGGSGRGAFAPEHPPPSRLGRGPSYAGPGANGGSGMNGAGPGLSGATAGMPWFDGSGGGVTSGKGMLGRTPSNKTILTGVAGGIGSSNGHAVDSGSGSSAAAASSHGTSGITGLSLGARRAVSAQTGMLRVITGGLSGHSGPNSSGHHGPTLACISDTSQQGSPHHPVSTGAGAGGPISPPWPRPAMSQRAQSGPARVSTESLTQGLGDTTHAPSGCSHGFGNFDLSPGAHNPQLAFGGGDLPGSPSARHGRRAGKGGSSAVAGDAAFGDHFALLSSPLSGGPSSIFAGDGKGATATGSSGRSPPNRSPARGRPSPSASTKPISSALSSPHDGAWLASQQHPCMPAAGGVGGHNGFTGLVNGSPADLMSLLQVKGGVDASVDFSMLQLGTGVGSSIVGGSIIANSSTTAANSLLASVSAGQPALHMQLGGSTPAAAAAAAGAVASAGNRYGRTHTASTTPSGASAAAGASAGAAQSHAFSNGRRLRTISGSGSSVSSYSLSSSLSDEASFPEVRHPLQPHSAAANQSNQLPHPPSGPRPLRGHLGSPAKSSKTPTASSTTTAAAATTAVAAASPPAASSQQLPSLVKTKSGFSASSLSNTTATGASSQLPVNPRASGKPPSLPSDPPGGLALSGRQASITSTFLSQQQHNLVSSDSPHSQAGGDSPFGRSNQSTSAPRSAAVSGRQTPPRSGRSGAGAGGPAVVRGASPVPRAGGVAAIAAAAAAAGSPGSPSRLPSKRLLPIGSPARVDAAGGDQGRGALLPRSDLWQPQDGSRRGASSPIPPAPPTSLCNARTKHLTSTANPPTTLPITDSKGAPPASAGSRQPVQQSSAAQRKSPGQPPGKGSGRINSPGQTPMRGAAAAKSAAAASTYSRAHAPDPVDGVDKNGRHLGSGRGRRATTASEVDVEESLTLNNFDGFGVYAEDDVMGSRQFEHRMAVAGGAATGGGAAHTLTTAQVIGSILHQHAGHQHAQQQREDSLNVRPGARSPGAADAAPADDDDDVLQGDVSNDTSPSGSMVFGTRVGTSPARTGSGGIHAALGMQPPLSDSPDVPSKDNGRKNASDTTSATAHGSGVVPASAVGAAAAAATGAMGDAPRANVIAGAQPSQQPYGGYAGGVAPNGIFPGRPYFSHVAGQQDMPPPSHLQQPDSYRPGTVRPIGILLDGHQGHAGGGIGGDAGHMQGLHHNNSRWHDEQETGQQQAAAADPGHHGGLTFDDDLLGDWANVDRFMGPVDLEAKQRAFTPPIFLPSQAAAEAAAARAAAQRAAMGCGSDAPQVLLVEGGSGKPKSVVAAAGEEMLDVVYDPILNCYYDAKAHQYYELR